MKRGVCAIFVFLVLAINISVSGKTLTIPDEIEMQATIDAEIRWRLQFDYHTSCTSVDLDHDGFFEILVLCQNKLYCLDYQGILQWTYTVINATRIENIGIADFDKDGDMELFFISYNYDLSDYRMTCLSSNSTTRWTYYSPGRLDNPKAVDLENNGNLEIVFYSGGYIKCLSLNGTLAWISEADGLLSNYDFADINGDGELEIIVIEPNSIGYPYGDTLYCLTSNGAIIWSSSEREVTFNFVITEDLSGNGKEEIICYERNGYDIICFDENGEIEWINSEIYQYQRISPLIFDVDSDSELEIVVFTYYEIIHISRTGVIERSFIHSNSHEYIKGLTLVDLDNNGVYEYLYNNGDRHATLCINQNGQFIWGINPGFETRGAPLVIDIDNDGVVEVLVSSGTYTFSKYYLTCVELTNVAKTGDCPWYDDFGSVFKTNSMDSDGDLLDDITERYYNTNKNDKDSDKDGLKDGFEVLSSGTDPTINDTDSDGLLDGWEIEYGLNPRLDDSDEDLDDDGISNIDEYNYGTNVLLNDTDSDGLLDSDELFIYFTDPLSADTDLDNLNDFDEIFVYLSSPLMNDTDLDYMIDGWEVFYNLDYLTNDSLGDLDFDGLSNLVEHNLNSNPASNDTDSDGLLDGDELFIYSTLLNSNDSDYDLLSDSDEVFVYLTNPISNDSDDDFLPDGWEVQYTLNPILNDSLTDLDDDRLSNLDEYLIGTNPQKNDSDNDFISDGAEVLDYFTNPLLNDTDQDNLADFEEIFDYSTNPNSNDTDYDELPDSWELFNGLNPLINDANHDTDYDGLKNFEEYLLFTSPIINDTDSDGMTDGWEVMYYLNPLIHDSANNHDSDSLTNLEEFILGTNPTSGDTDGDGISDDYEVFYGLNPLDNNGEEDSDNDGLTNRQEYDLGLSPISNDTDSDGMPDFYEFSNQLEPNNHNDGSSDADADYLSNLQEFLRGTDPNDPDSDDDGFLDGVEVDKGLNPLDPDSNPQIRQRRLLLSLDIPLFILLLGLSYYIFTTRIKKRKKLREERLRAVTSLGFSSLEEMDNIQNLGFESKSEYEKIKKLGFKTKKEYLTTRLANALLDVWGKNESVDYLSRDIIKSKEPKHLEELKNQLEKIEKELLETQLLIDEYSLLTDGKFQETWITGISKVGELLDRISALRSNIAEK